eukprot:4129987-Prymnesium_polylepis.1
MQCPEARVALRRCRCRRFGPVCTVQPERSLSTRAHPRKVLSGQRNPAWKCLLTHDGICTRRVKCGAARRHRLFRLDTGPRLGAPRATLSSRAASAYGT